MQKTKTESVIILLEPETKRKIQQIASNEYRPLAAHIRMLILKEIQLKEKLPAIVSYYEDLKEDPNA